MTYVALVALLTAALTVGTTAQLVRSLIRQHARERELILNQMLHLAGRTWTPPPAEQWEAPPENEDRFVYAPSQLPDDEE